MAETFGVPRMVPLPADLDVEAFDCGEDAQNAWFRQRALSSQARDDARTYVMLDGLTVLGFHALTVGSIVRSDLPGALRRNAPDPVGYVLLAQLAVGLPFHKTGLGANLVIHALSQAVRLAELAGCRLFATHPARESLVPFYHRFGLVEVATTPLLMAMTMVRVRATLAGVGATDE